MDIKAGDTVKVPKGTEVFLIGGDRTTAARDSVVKIKSIITLKNPPHHDELGIRFGGMAFWKGTWDAAEFDIQTRSGGDFRLVEWSGQKTAFIKNVSPVEAKAKKEYAGPNKRAQMVKGSKWRVIAPEDFTLSVQRDDWWGYVEACRRKFPNKPENEIEKLLAAQDIHRFSQTPYVSVAVGDELEITGKFMTYSSDRMWEKGIGMFVPVKVHGKDYHLGYLELEPIIEAASVPQVKEYVLRDSATGKMFAGFSYNPATLASGVASPVCANAMMVDDFMKAKRFPDIARLKQGVLGFTGYYAGMPTANRPEWASERKLMDLPETWEIACYDKLARKEVLEPLEDVQEWLKTSWRLRALTIHFGSSVRAVYKDIEKLGQVQQYAYILSLRAERDEH